MGTGLRSSTAGTLAAAVARGAAETPDRPAVIFLAEGEAESGRATYAQLHARVNAIAAALQAQGLEGERALLMLPTGVEYVEGFLACLAAGVLAVPVYSPSTSMHAERLSRIIADSRAACVITTRKVHDGLAARFERLVAGGTRYFLIDEEPAGVAGTALAPARGDGVAYLQYTSGSTGDPRGVIITHENLVRYQACWQAQYASGPDDVFVSWVPLFHDMGLIMGLVQPLMLGATTVLMPPPAFLQRPLRWLQAISRYRGTFSEGPNFAYELCCDRVDAAQLAQLDLSSWRIAINGAEPVRAGTLARFVETFGPAGFRRETFVPAYGLAESTLAVTAVPRARGARVAQVDAEALRANRLVEVAGDGARPLVGCGPALPGITVAVVDPEARRPRPDGEVGEVWVKGPIVAGGYWQRAQETAEIFEARLADGDGPYLRTGDLGVRAGGELYIAGRLKDILIVNGQNHYPQDLEQTAAAAHPAVSASRAAAFPVEVGGQERVVVAIEVRRTERRGLDGAAVAGAVRTAIVAEHGVRPYAVLLLRPATIQMTSSGKIQRRACKSSYLAGTLEPLHQWTEADGVGVEEAPAAAPAAAVPARPARSEAEITAFLAGQVARYARLAPAQVRTDRPFAEFGLDSVDIVELSGALAEWLGKPVEASELFSYPDVGRLARFLAGGAPAVPSTMPVPARTPAPVATPAPAVPPAPAVTPAPVPPPAPAALAGPVDRADDDPVAVVGMACRFPGAPSLEDYWRLLDGGVDAIQEVPASRFRVDDLYQPGAAAPGTMSTRSGGFLEGVDRFDAGFFGISPREAESMDPQQRILLETVWHALEDAGIPPPSLAGASAGVFVGVATTDYKNVQWTHGAGRDAWAGTGTASSIAANRISYVLDLRGPSMAVDTACSSSLVALHQARQSLLAGECDLAIVAGVNLILAPDLTVVFSQARMMSPDGRCKTFDARADGYVRGEGCGVLVLKRRADARRDGDRIAALLVGSAVNQDGRSNGLTAPNGAAQEAVMRRALASARLAPGDVSYVEAHGTGTSLGDPIEVNALRAVYGAPGEGAPTLWVGSVKTNIGHLEAAAGVAGVIKVVLALQRGAIPAHLHLRELNPAIRLEGTRLAIPRRAVGWETGGGPRAAAVSSFGFGGTNAHVVLREAEAAASAVAEPAEGPALLTLSARSAGALRALTQRWAAHLDAEAPEGWPVLCRSARLHRAHHVHRLAVVSRRKADAARALERHLAGEEVDGLFVGAVAGAPGKVAFLFTGQGSQYPEMGYGLFRAHAGFRRELERCDAILAPVMGESLLDVMFAPGAADRLASTAFAQPALFALEYALAAALRAGGIRPDVVIGHSLGEYVAACLAGVFSLEDGLRLVAHRGRLMQQRTRPGAMYAVGGTPELIERVLRGVEERAGAAFSLAAHNAPGEVVLSGDSTALEPWLEHLAEGGARITQLHVTRAFHSPLMEEMLEEFGRCAREVTYHPPQLPVVSNRTGQVADASVASPEYWVGHVRDAVRFAAGVEALVGLGCDTMVEIGPHPVLTGAGRQIAPGARWIPTLRRNKDPREELERCLAAWYASGREADWRTLESEAAGTAVSRPPAALPRYPFEPERHWVPAGAPIAASAGRPALPALLGRELDAPEVTGRAYQTTFGAPALAYLRQHRVLDTAVLPAAATLELMATAFRAGAAGAPEGCALEDVVLRRPVPLPDDVEVVAHVRCEAGPAAGTARIRCFAKRPGAPGAGWEEFASSTAVPLAGPGAGATALRAPGAGERLEAAAAYARFEELGMQYGPAFRGLRWVERDGDSAVAEVALSREADPSVARGVPTAAVLDACLHALVAFTDPSATAPMIPVAVRRLELARSLPEQVRVQVTGVRAGDGGRLQADLLLTDAGGTPVGSVQGLEVRTVSRDTLAERLGRAPFEEYRLGWHPLALQEIAPMAAPGPWVVYGDAAAIATWRSEAAAVGRRVVGIVPGARMGETGEDLHTLDLEGEAPLRFFEELARRHPDVAGLVLLAGAPPATTGADVLPVTYARAREGHAVLRGFLRACGAAQPAVVVCTRGAHVTGAGDRPVLAESVVSGMARAVAAEFPAVRCVQVELEPGAALPPFDTLLRSAARGSGAVARRGGAWLAGTLERAGDVARATAAGAPPFRGDASYLVTGGTGGLGLAVAEWLAASGAGAVVLASRGGALEPERLAALRAAGARVEVVKADVADLESCRALLRRIDEDLPPLRGVFHAAGVLEDGPLVELAWPRFAAVLDAKVRGGWNLHHLTEGRALDHFVLFSSLASLLGSAGQCNYAAANAFLDALAHVRRQAGQHALSVNWGPWAGAGMATRHGRLERLARAGLTGLAPDHALAALGGALALDGAAPPQLGIAQVDWSRWLSGEGARVPDALLARFQGAPAQPATPAGPRLDLDALSALPPEEAQARLVGDLLVRVARVLRLDDRRREALAPTFAASPLSELGLDSLMAVELHNRIKAELAVDVPVHRFIGGATPADLAQFVHQQAVLRRALTASDAAADDADHEVFTL